MSIEGRAHLNDAMATHRNRDGIRRAMLVERGDCTMGSFRQGGMAGFCIQTCLGTRIRFIVPKVNECLKSADRFLIRLSETDSWDFGFEWVPHSVVRIYSNLP